MRLRCNKALKLFI